MANDQHLIVVSEESYPKKVVRASDCTCIECGKPAVAFWPVVDPDIPSHPYCRECLDRAKDKLIRKIFNQ